MRNSNTIHRVMSNIHSNVVPILFLRKEPIMDSKEIVCKLIDYESPLDFHVRQYNPEFEPFMDHVKFNLNSRRILTKNDLVINMYVFVQKNGSNSIHRGRIVKILPDIIEVHLVDNGNTTIKEQFNTLTLYEFIESDGNIPRQHVIQCKLNNMWFPDNMDVDTKSMLRQFFDRELLYKILIVENDLYCSQSINLIEKDTNIDISEAIIKAGIGQRICAAIKTDEFPYEVSVLKGQNFLAYIYQYLCKLYIQPEPNVVNELEEEIQEYVKENPNPESLDMRKLRNKYCLATVNHLWYRAQVKHVTEESIIVNLFDTGYLTEVSHKQIRPISSDLMKKPQLSVCCSLENKDFVIEKNAKKVLYNVTAQSIDTNGMLRVTVKEHCATPLSSPMVRSIEKISFVHVDGDSTYLRRSQDESKIVKMSETLLASCGKLAKSKPVVPGDVAVFESGRINYRCLVKSKESGMAVVHCIDSGREELVEESKLQYLGRHSKIALLPALVTVVPTFPMAIPMSQRCGDVEFLADMRAVDDESEKTAPTQCVTQNELQEKSSLADEKKNDLFVPDVTVKKFTNFRNFETKSETISSLYEERINSELNLYKNRAFRGDKFIHNVLERMGQTLVSFSRATGRLCRGRVFFVTKEWTSCYRLDHGELEVFHEFYEPTDFLRTCPPMWMSCALYSPKLVDIAMETTYWYSYVDRLVKDIVTAEGVKFSMVVKSESPAWGDNKSEVTLLLDNVDIGEMLTARIESNKNYLDYKKRLSAEKKKLDLLVPDVETVTVADFQTFRKFETKSETLSSLYADRIDAELKWYNDGKNANDKHILNFHDWGGSIIVGRSHETGELRRVIISAISSFAIMCFQLDHGSHEEFSEFYEPTEFLHTCPPIWRSCALYAPSFVGKELENWFPNIDFLFKDIVSIEGVKFDMIVKKKGQEENYVPSEVMLLLDNVDVSKMLRPISVWKKVDPRQNRCDTSD